MNKIENLFPIDIDNEGDILHQKISDVLSSLCYQKDQDIKIGMYARAIMIAFRKYESMGIESAIEYLDSIIVKKKQFADHSDKGFPVKIKADKRWPLVCENDCIFKKKCANSASAGDYRSESGTTPDFEKNEDGTITCYGSTVMNLGMRLFDKKENPTNYYQHYYEEDNL